MTDNVEADFYRYRISVDTAMNIGSGTSVCPLFRLVGTHGKTEVRCLKATGRTSVSDTIEIFLIRVRYQIWQAA